MTLCTDFKMAGNRRVSSSVLLNPSFILFELLLAICFIRYRFAGVDTKRPGGFINENIYLSLVFALYITFFWSVTIFTSYRSSLID